MTVQDIGALNVSDCAADDCDLYLLTTQKYFLMRSGVGVMGFQILPDIDVVEHDVNWSRRVVLPDHRVFDLAPREDAKEAPN